MTVMKRIFTNNSATIAVAVAYLLATQLGLWAGTGQLFESPFWPPGGVALAAVLLLGYRVWPGLLVGACAATLFKAGLKKNPWTRDGLFNLAAVFDALGQQEFRQRIRFDLDWGYDWAPFYSLLVTAREHGEAIYGLDCMPREDLRKIGARDRHAAHKIAEIRARHPHAVIVVLFGESHLAPGHLPRQLRRQLREDRILTVLQNVDALYWRAAGERAPVVCWRSLPPLSRDRAHVQNFHHGFLLPEALAPLRA